MNLGNLDVLAKEHEAVKTVINNVLGSGCIWCGKTLNFSHCNKYSHNYHATWNGSSTQDIEAQYHIHHQCKEDFVTYWLTASLDAKDDIYAKRIYTYSCSYNVDYRQMMEDSNIKETIMGNIVRDAVHNIGGKGVVEEVLFDVERDDSRLSTRYIFRAAVRPICVVCGSSECIKAPNHIAYPIYNNESIPFPREIPSREALLQTADKKFFFHRSCINRLTTKFVDGQL